ncbi:MAG: DUF1836 domain-containing protein [Bacillota bacterium]|nr:DUF1836 domain-containing protein [Bacillota bacterium]
MEKNLDLYEYSKAMSEVKLIRWKDLPQIPLYCDQLLQIVNAQLSFLQVDDEMLITKSMVNNYVKLAMMPKPEKKKYEKLHLAYAIVITILKQVLPITKIKDGIQLQVILQGNERAYDAFCEALEESIRMVFSHVLDKGEPYIIEERKIEHDKLALSSITTALSNMLLTEKIIETKIKRFNKPDTGEGEAHE